MKLETIMFIGRSGCGKGTQSDLLMRDLAQTDPERKIFYLESGQKFREFIARGSFSSELSQAIMKKGGLQPSFLAVWNWAHLLVENLTANEHLIFDGTPRKLDEAMILDTAMKFYQRERPTVIHLKVSKDWSRARLTARGRSDDATPEAIEKRLNWFDTDVMPTIEYFRTHPDYDLLEINGEQTIEEVHAEIAKALASR